MMATAMYILGILLFSFIPTKEALHIFQQNHYHLDRYATWLSDKFEEKKSNVLSYFLLFLPFFALLAIFQHPNILALEALLLFVYAYVMLKMDDDKTYVKPFSYTARVIRQLLFQYFLYALCIVLLLKCPRIFLVILTPCFYLFSWLFVGVSGWCMKIVETQIQKYYINDAKHIRMKNHNLCVIGITGSYGKTSVKTILQELLSNRYYTLMTPNSYNNLMGITKTIRSMLRTIHEVFICEMGADHVHEIKQLAGFVEPNIGVVTAIGPQHLQTFHSIENIIHEKMQLIEHLPTDGIAFLNADNKYMKEYKLNNRVPVIWFSIEQASDYQAGNIHYHANGMSFTICFEKKEYAFETKLLGEHNVRNITTAVAIAHTLGISMNILQKTVLQLPYVEHRLQLRQTPTYTLLDNAYNSNPEGAKESLAVLMQMPGKHILITPGFIDLGTLQEDAHRSFGKQIAQAADEVILIGMIQTRAIQEGLSSTKFPSTQIHVVTSTQQALQLASQFAHKGDTVLIENDLPDAFNH